MSELDAATSEALSDEALAHLAVHRTRVLLCLLAVYVIWGSSYLAIRISLEGLPPLFAAGSRQLLAGIIVYWGLRWTGLPHPTLAQWTGSAKVALLLIVATSGSVSFAEQWVGSGVSAVAFGAAPLWAGLFAGLWERWPSRPECIGLAVGFAGVLMLHVHSNMHAHPVAAIALIGAGMSWALGSIYSRHVILPPGLMAAATQMLAGGIVLIAASPLVGESLREMPTTAAILAIIYLAVFSSVIGFSAYTYLIHHTTPALAVSHAYVNPAVAVLLGVFLNRERVTTGETAAIVLTVGAVFFIMQGKGKRELPHARKGQRLG